MNNLLGDFNGFFLTFKLMIIIELLNGLVRHVVQIKHGDVDLEFSEKSNFNPPPMFSFSHFHSYT